MEKGEYYSIGEVAKLCKIPIKTLRYYDEIQLLEPSLRKETSKYRYYGKDQLVTVFMIRKLRIIGFGLKDIKKILDENTIDELEKFIYVKLENIKKEIQLLQKTYEESQAFLGRIKTGKAILDGENRDTDNFEICEIPRIHLYSMRNIIKSYRNEDVNLERWIDINERARKDELEVCGPIFVTYHMEILGQLLSNDCDIEFSIQVKPPEQPHENIHQFGGFLAATAHHIGTYAEIFKTYIALKRRIEEEKYEIIGPATEEFIVSPIDINNTNQHVTRIIIPVKKI